MIKTKKFVFWIWNFIESLKFGFKNLEGGYSALITTLITVFASLAVIGGLTLFSLQEVSTNRVFVRSIESRFISEGGIEDGVYRVITGKQIASSEILGVGKGTTTIFVTEVGNNRIIRSEGRRNNVQHNLETRIDISVASSNFNYGLQVGEGGLTMANNARVVGSVFSNGSIVGGSSNSTITGDAFVAAGIPAAVDQSWEVQNTDYSVGISSGAIVSLVDSAGDVGSYNSIALGSDGFARISYYDITNKDLKYARCLNSDCSQKNITTVESSGDVGQFSSLVLGSDGFARISYYENTGSNLKFVRCLDADCASKNITTVESSGDVGQFSSLVLGSDGFARISYYKTTSGDLKFARCTNADCTAKNISTVESTNDVGKYTSIALGSDGFARISYFDETNDDLRFARCTDIDCTGAVINTVDASGDAGGLKISMVLGSDGFARISYFEDIADDLRFSRCTNADCAARVLTTVDSSGNVGKYNSLRIGSDGFARISYYGDGNLRFARCLDADCAAINSSDADNTSNDLGHYTSLELGSDGFGRISHYDNTAGDLRFVLCTDADCIPPDPQIDVSQSFQPTITDRVVSIDLYLRKIGSPANTTLRLIKDSSGSPSTNPADVLATGAINSAGVPGSYAWLNIPLSATPVLNANTSYWIVFDASFDNSNYYVWGGDAAAGYSRGSTKRTGDWQIGGWISLSADLDFRVYMGGTDTELQSLIVGGNAHAHKIDDVIVSGNADAFTLVNSTVNGNVHASNISNCTINGDAEYNTATSCTILGSQTTPTTPPSDPTSLGMPIPQSTIDGWKSYAEAGGVCVPPQCDVSGNFVLGGGEFDSIGPKKITGKLIMDNNSILTVTGNLWVVGNIELSNGCLIRLSPGYGALSGIIITDSNVIISNNCAFQGSGDPASYVMLMSEKDAPASEIMTVENNSAGVIYYADSGRIRFRNNATAKEATAYGMTLDQNATITYESGLANVNFSSGPSGGYNIVNWLEVE